MYGGTNIVSGVVTQGSPTSNEWVSSFKVRIGVVECELRYIVDSDDASVVSTYIHVLVPLISYRIINIEIGGGAPDKCNLLYVYTTS